MDIILIILSALVIMSGMIVYYKLRKKHYKKICTLKVEAHVVEKKQITGSGKGYPITIRGAFRPVFAFDINGAEHLLTEKKRAWTDLELEAYPEVILWVNPQNIEQFRYEDARLEAQDIGGYIYVGIAFMIIAVLVVFSF